jgi:hypothetical protein
VAGCNKDNLLMGEKPRQLTPFGFRMFKNITRANPIQQKHLES